ncbi:hypothetical protein [Ferrimonas senticii]|uniref:hypothetical protein n=1 Tax=Ferrimonas senticii TaxID=394566 RepID=UPI0004243F3B|nr:hypothetical protein [Ferrimonas senticii]
MKRVSIDLFENLRGKLAAVDAGQLPSLSEQEIKLALGGVKAVFPIGLCVAEMRKMQATGFARQQLLGMQA